MTKRRRYQILSAVLLFVGIALIVILESAQARVFGAEPSSIIGILIFLSPSAIFGSLAKWTSD